MGRVGFRVFRRGPLQFSFRIWRFSLFLDSLYPETRLETGCLPRLPGGPLRPMRWVIIIETWYRPSRASGGAHSFEGTPHPTGRRLGIRRGNPCIAMPEHLNPPRDGCIHEDGRPRIAALRLEEHLLKIYAPLPRRSAVLLREHYDRTTPT